MKRYAKFRGWIIVSLMLSLLASGFLADTPKASAMTRSSYIYFWIPTDQVTYLRVEGNNQYDRAAAWSQTYSPATGSAITAYGNTKWWWNGTVVLTFRGRNMGQRRCIIDSLNTASNMTVVSYTPGLGCSGETGNAQSWERTVEEMSNYMERDDAYRVVDATHAAMDAGECAVGIAEGLAGHLSAMVIPHCGGAALYVINPILQKYGTSLSTGSNTGAPGRWTVRVFNMDDAGGAVLNRDWSNPVAQASYSHSDTGWVDITARMHSGLNSLVFTNWNDGGGYTWGFQVAYNGRIVWNSQAGQQGVRGANNDDMSRPQQYTRVEWLVLHPDGTVTQE